MTMRTELVETFGAYEAITAEQAPARRRRRFLAMLMPFDPLFAPFGVALGGTPDRALQALA